METALQGTHEQLGGPPGPKFAGQRCNRGERFAIGDEAQASRRLTGPPEAMSLRTSSVTPEGGMRSDFRMAIEGQISEVGRFAAAFADFASERQLPTEVRRSLQVVLDDLLANVVLHGLAGRAGGEATIDVAVADDVIVVTVSDNGPPFDPFAQAAPDTSLGIEERQIGGLGIHLVKQMMDDVSYQRREDRNVTVLRKRLYDGTSHSNSGGK